MFFYLKQNMYGVVLLFALCAITAAFEGDTCVKDGVNGVCVNIRKCKSAIADIQKRKPPQICSFDNSDPVVCCLDSQSTATGTATTSRPPAATTVTSRPATTTTEYEPPTYVYTDNEGGGECEAISPSMTSPKTGQKSWDKCIEYQETLVYPCEKGVALTGELSRGNHCAHNADDLIVGGEDAARNEFPHMALLGYGDDVRNLQWLCGGAVISDRFILTAGHCISSRDAGNVTYAIVSALLRSEESVNRRYKIKTIIKHPDYRPPSKYNDIALLETEKPIKLDQFTVPACLHTGDAVNDEKALATGWGLTTYRGTAADVLQKVTIHKFPREECAAKFRPQRLMKNGFDEKTQTCYGEKSASKDTCQGDSGGPLQIKSKKIHCMYILVGVTSFGKACGFIGEPGIYTRVANYVPWIESIVWP